MRDFLTNGMHGEIHITLDRTDAGDSPDGVSYELSAAFFGDQQGSDNEPQVWLIVGRDLKAKGDDASHLFCVSTSRLRRICELAESMHKVGDDQFKHREGANPDE